jgi:hypothetical protein
MLRIEGPVTDEQYEEIREAAGKAGLSMRRYVTKATLKNVRETPIQDQIEVVVSCIAQVASNIQSLAAMHQSMLVLHAEMAMATRNILETQARVERTLQDVDQGYRKLRQMSATIETELRDHRQEALVGLQRLERLTDDQERQRAGPRVYTPNTLDGENKRDDNGVEISPTFSASLQ